jgi:hypothetical protein
MKTPETPTSRKLRLWPGIIIVALLFISRFGVKAVIPGIEGFGKGMMGSFGFVIIFLLWWASLVVQRGSSASARSGSSQLQSAEHGCCDTSRCGFSGWSVTQSHGCALPLSSGLWLLVDYPIEYEG